MNRSRGLLRAKWEAGWTYACSLRRTPVWKRTEWTYAFKPGARASIGYLRQEWKRLDNASHFALQVFNFIADGISRASLRNGTILATHEHSERTSAAVRS